VACALNLLCDLFALQNIEADKGFRQEHGRLASVRTNGLASVRTKGLASVRTKSVTREGNRLCNAVRRQAGPLIDALGVPDAILRAPLGLRDPAPADR